MKVLITGGAGFIGSSLARELVARGERVTIFDNFSTGLRSNLADMASDLEVIEADLRDSDALLAATKGMEVIFHQGAMPSVPRSVDDPRTSFEVNAGGTLNVLDAAVKNSVRRVVYAASSSAYGDTPTLPKHEAMPQNPQSPYAADKVHGENLCKVFHRVYGLETVGLRYFNVYGPYQRPDSAYAAVIPRFIHTLMEGQQPTIYGDGTQSRDFTFIKNVAELNILASTAKDAPGRIMNGGAGSRTNLLELLHLIGKSLGVETKPNFEPTRKGDVKDSQADISQAREILGYDPAVSLEDGIAQTVAWFRQQRQTA